MKQLLSCLLLLVTIQQKTPAQQITFQHFNEANTLQFAGTNNMFTCIGMGGDVYMAGTQYRGLYRYDTTVKVWFKSTELTNVFINDIKRDRNGGAWVAQSGIQGSVGGGSAIGGGVNYFPGRFDSDMRFFSVPGTTTGGGLYSRNVRSVFLDTFRNRRIAEDTTLPRVWVASNTYITSFNTQTGGVNVGLQQNPDYFLKRIEGLQLAPFNGSSPVGTPSCDAIGGDERETWVSVRQNFGRSQIIRYKTQYVLKLGGVIRPAFDNVSVPGIFPAGFRAQAIFFDSEKRRWVGFQSGGMVVQENGVWSKLTTTDMFSIFPAGTMINNNAMVEDLDGNVYIGTNNGLVVFDGGGAVTDTTRYIRYTTADGLLSNNITGMAYDARQGRLLLTSSGGVTFMKVINPIDVKMEWDFSYPDTYRKPKGVAADGVSRIYLKIKNGLPNLPRIKEVAISIDDYFVTDSTQRGKLKAATVLDAYSDEANSGLERDVISTTPTKVDDNEFWFWYVAPADFCRDSTGALANLSVRTDDIKIKVTYEDNTTADRVFNKLRVVRPPLVLVHGLASGPGTWKNLKYGNDVLFTSSDRFKYVSALTINGKGKFYDNAKLLVNDHLTALAGDASRVNTLPYNIEQLRFQGYAANQVDYVCHSMGGNVIRLAMDKFKFKFYVNEQSTDNKYKNYGAGYTHKIITINTPHNSSIVADAVYDFIPNAPTLVNDILRLAYNINPNFQIPFDFVEPNNPDPKLYQRQIKFKATDALTNLKVRDEGGGINLAETKAKFHMITGNVNLISDQTSATLEAFDPTLKYAAYVVQSMLDSRLIPKNIKVQILEPALKAINAGRAVTFFEWYSGQLGFPQFGSQSDLIVPLASQNARVPLPGAKPYISAFTNSPGSIIDASHVTIQGRRDVGQKVYNLLNTGLYSTAFGDVIPANNDPEPPTGLVPRPANTNARPANTPLNSMYYDTSKIKIDLPVQGNTVFADTAINVQFRVKDTTNLSYVLVHFQNADTFRLDRTLLQQTVPITVSPEYPGNQEMWAVAAYYTPDNGLEYYLDTFSLTVNNKATLKGFRVNDTDIVINKGVSYYPPYQVAYQTNNWISLPNSDTTITVTFDPVGVAELVDSTRAIKVLSAGITAAVFKYGNFRDTVTIETTLPFAAYAINQTIAAGNFKNPAIWSRGIVPYTFDSVEIRHNVLLDTSMTIGSMRISAGASLLVNNAGTKLTLGDIEEAWYMIDNYGSLVIQQGQLNVLGRVKMNAGSSFNMSGGLLKIDGNIGFAEGSVNNGLSLFEAAPAMSAFSFTGGTLQIADPPFGNASQTLDCPYDFGNNSILMLGDGVSVDSSKITDGFGGTLFPNKIGRLVIDAKIKTGNREFISSKPLNIKGGVEVRTGSGIVIKAPITVNQ